MTLQREIYPDKSVSSRTFLLAVVNPSTWSDVIIIIIIITITPILDKLLEYKKNWIQHVNRMPRNRLPRVTKHYSPTGKRNHGRPLKRLLDT
jgi:hypothetical protein